MGWKEEAEGGAEFEFKVTFHEHLFWVLQVDKPSWPRSHFILAFDDTD